MVNGILRPIIVHFRPIIGSKSPVIKPPNIAPTAKAVSLVFLGLTPKDLHAISSSLSASQALPTGNFLILMVKKFVLDSISSGYKKIIIITGKGLRSKVYDDPYRSKEMGVLKNSVPEFIRNDEDLKGKISKITKAELKDGGEGALYIFLK